MRFFFVRLGKWLVFFDFVFTEIDIFYLDKYKAVKVVMMYKVGMFVFIFDRNFRCYVFKFFYRGNVFMLVVFTEKIGDYFVLEDYLSIELVDTWFRNMKIRYGFFFRFIRV